MEGGKFRIKHHLTKDEISEYDNGHWRWRIVKFNCPFFYTPLKLFPYKVQKALRDNLTKFNLQHLASALPSSPNHATGISRPKDSGDNRGRRY